MKIFLRDRHINEENNRSFYNWQRGKLGGGSSPWKDALEHDEAFGPKHLGNVKSDASDFEKEIELENDQAIVFLHCSGTDLRGLWFEQFDERPARFKGYVIRISTDGGIRPSDVPLGLMRAFGCWWRPEDFAKPVRAEVKEFIRSVKDGRPRFELLQPRDKSDSPDLLPAIAVLCQGYLLAMNPTKELPNVHRDKVQEEVQTSAWWKQPFQEFTGARMFSAELESEWGEKIPDSVDNLVAEIFDGSTIAGATVEQAARAMAGRLGYSIPA